MAKNYLQLWTRTLIVVLLIISFLNHCTKLSRSFYIDQIDMRIDLEELRNGLYRIYIYRSLEDRGKDYIDVNYRMSEMPSVSLCFPTGNSNDIYIVECVYTEVNSYKSSNFNIIHPKINKYNVLEQLKYSDWCDSIRFGVPNITLRIDAYLDGISIWNENNDQIDKITPIY